MTNVVFYFGYFKNKQLKNKKDLLIQKKNTTFMPSFIILSFIKK